VAARSLPLPQEFVPNMALPPGEQNGKIDIASEEVCGL